MALGTAAATSASRLSNPHSATILACSEGLGPMCRAEKDAEKDVAVGSVGLEEADDADDTDMGAPSHCDRGIPAPYSELPLCHGHLRVSPRVTHGLHLG